MYQRTKYRCNFPLLTPFQVGEKAVMFFLVVICLLFLPAVTLADCVQSGGHCTSQGECGDKLKDSGGPGTYTLNWSGLDCVCWGVSNEPDHCICCGYDIPNPPPCQDGDPCCGDSCCGDPCCGKCPCPDPANGHTGG